MKRKYLLLVLAGFWILSFGQEPVKVEIITADLFFSEIMDST